MSVATRPAFEDERPFPDPDHGLLMGDIFAGIGGWSHAAGAHWTCVFAAEMEEHARKVWEANHKRKLDCGDILKAPASNAKFAHLYAISFPCQSSSYAGKRKGKKDARGGKVLGKALRMVSSAKPVIIVLENVPGFASVDNGKYFGWLRAQLETMGYPTLISKVLGTHEFGIPQQRKRLYMVAFRNDCAEAAASFRFPVGDEQKTPTLTKFLKRRLAKRYCNTIRCGGRGSKDRHAWDMLPRSKGGWYQLTVDDCKRLMGFSQSFKMPVPPTQQFRLLGNSVTLEPARSILCECKLVVAEAYANRVRAGAV